MNARGYIWRSLAYYRFSYAGVWVGAVLGATVLLGALFAGDSVKASLLRIAGLRIGQATHVLTGGDRFFREALAPELAAKTRATAAPVVLARGTAAHGATAAMVNRAQLVGVTAEFWQLSPEPFALDLNPGATAMAVNAPLAARLGLKVGDPLVIRLQKPGILPGNAPVAGSDTAVQALRGTVTAIVSDDHFGRFNLESTQVASPAVFLPIARLQEALGQAGRSNLMLLRAPAAAGGLERTLRETMQLADYGLNLRWLETAQAFELTSTRIFIDPSIAEALRPALPDAQPVLSYLVNEFQLADRSTPYSMATAADAAAAPFLPALGRNEIALNQWLADDLQAHVGDEVRIKFFQADRQGSLVERDAALRLRAIVPLSGLAADRAWMPDFPGMTNVQHQSDWDPGLPLKLERIRPKDERYWDDYRGAPKAFVSLETGRELWSTRWGQATALRIPWALERRDELTRQILRTLAPAMNQIQVRDVRMSAARAAESPVDFAGLFIGMSCFLIAAALALVAMLFQFALLQRNREDALLGAVGIPGRKRLRWRLAEATVLLVTACACALPLATIYTRSILRLLESIWSRESAGATFIFAAAPSSVACGIIGFVALSLAAIWLAIRRQTQVVLSVRLAAKTEDIALPARVRRTSTIVTAVALVMAAGSVALSGRGLPPEVAFYLAGFALLLAGIAFCRRALAHEPSTVAAFDAAYLGRLNLRRRRTRSVTVVALIATAVFMVLSVAAFRKQVGDEWRDRRSGTGGFAIWLETTAPLNPARDGRAVAGFDVLDPVQRDIAEVLPLRLGTGDNLNCFNLNSTLQPQLLGVDAARLAARQAFTVQPSTAGWSALQAHDADAVPGFVDATTLQWALKRKLGDVLDYTDENGRPFRVRLVGALPDSIFQGYVLIDEQALLRRFPSHAGYSILLIDPRSGVAATDLRVRLATTTRDFGGRVELTREVLASFHEIENTYIGIFNVLGSLGVILGSLGLAIVVARNLRERQGEFTVLLAMGIPRHVLGRMVAAEFGRLIGWGIVIGAVASLIAIAPNATRLPPAATLGLAMALLGGIVLLNLASGWLVFRRSLGRLRLTAAVQGL